MSGDLDQSHNDAAFVERVMALDAELSADGARSLCELSRRHKVSWEVWPERQVFDGVVKQIGFELDLAGRSERPGQQRCLKRRERAEIAHALKTIALFLLPEPGRASRYDIEQYSGAVRYPNDTSAGGYVTLTIRILHRGRFEAPPDECEVRCLEEMEAKLRALGARVTSRRLGQPPANVPASGKKPGESG